MDPESVESNVADKSNVIEIKKATFAWGESEQLHDIDLNIKEGSITAIVGQVGSGKSSILQVCRYIKGNTRRLDRFKILNPQTKSSSNLKSFCAFEPLSRKVGGWLLQRK